MKQTWRRLVGAGLLLSGAAMMALAAAATALGIDHNAQWGAPRKALFAAGAVFSLGGLRVLLSQWIERVAEDLKSSAVDLSRGLWNALAVRRARAGLRQLADGLARGTGRLPGATYLTRRLMPSLAAGACHVADWRLVRFFFRTRKGAVIFSGVLSVGFVIAVYVWLVSVGRWTAWPATSAYYDMLAQAFIRGQTHLLAQPPAALLQLGDPYNPDARAGLTYIWDASLFRGQYFLYWGPAPALLLLPVKWLTGLRIGDQYLVFAFTLGAFLLAAWLLVQIWADGFKSLPWWTLFPCLLALGLANPMPWLLNSPWIYEAAISAGQMFFLGGLALAYPALSHRQLAAGRLTAAGILWALAIGSRTSLAPAILLVTGVVFLIWLRQLRRGAHAMLASMSGLGIPIAAGLAAIGGYNYARFGNVLEFGQRYQLSSLNLSKLQGQIISLANFPPNFYNYLLNPVKLLRVFPYIKPKWGGNYVWPLYMPTPEAYYTRQIAGLALMVPVALFGLYAIYRLGSAWWTCTRTRSPDLGIGGRETGADLILVGGVLAGSIVLAAAPIFLYIVASMRYQADFIPTVILLSSIGVWEALHTARQRSRGERRIALLALALLAITVVFGLLLAVTSYDARFEKLNPVLFDRLTRFFSW
jgi:hypothetical protein